MYADELCFFAEKNDGGMGHHLASSCDGNTAIWFGIWNVGPH